MNFKEVKKVYLIGIGGIGVSAVAKYFLALGKEVIGSDVVSSDITKELERIGVKVNYDQVAENISSDIDLVIRTSAVPETNLEFQQANNFDIPQLTYFEFLGKISEEYTTIAISGTHGKSTTTSLLSMILVEAGLDPTVFVGTKVAGLKSNFRLGQSKYLVVESCEYMANMLKINPDYMGLASVEEDHLDFYRDLDHIKETFQEFISKLENKENLVYNQDNHNLQSLNLETSFSSGLNQGELHIQNLVQKSGSQEFELIYQGNNLGLMQTNLPGEYNIHNILIATGLALKLGVDIEVIKKAVREFKGLWRRFEYVGEWNSNTMISDYGHHPTAVKSLLKGVRNFYPDKKVVIVFQPHQEDRTVKFFDEFVDSFQDADDTILYPIYKVEGRREEVQVSSEKLVEAIQEKYPEQQVSCIDNYDSLEKYLEQYQNEMILVVGAGTIDNFVRHHLKINI